MANEITTQATGLKSFNQFVANPRTQEYLQSVLSDKKASFVNNLTALVSNNAMLQACKPETVMFASLKATALDLPLDQSLGFAYVLPYKDNKTGITSAQFQLGYKGFIQLALRSGQFRLINVTDVRKGEIQDEDFLTGERTFKRSDKRESLPVIGYVAFFELLNGFRKSLYMTVEELKAHALRFSQTYRKGYGLWADKEMFPKMCEKTVLKMLLSKYAPMSVEMRDAIKADSAVLSGEDDYNYVDSTIEDQGAQAEPQVSEQAKAKAEEVAAAIAKTKERRAAAEAKAEPEAPVAAGPEQDNLFPEQK